MPVSAAQYVERRLAVRATGALVLQNGCAASALSCMNRAGQSAHLQSAVLPSQLDLPACKYVSQTQVWAAAIAIQRADARTADEAVPCSPRCTASLLPMYSLCRDSNASGRIAVGLSCMAGLRGFPCRLACACLHACGALRACCTPLLATGSRHCADMLSTASAGARCVLQLPI